MLDRIRDQFGTAGLIVAVVALVAALGGSAVALSGSEKKEVKKFSKSFSKNFSKKFSKQFAKAGPAGPQGLPGTNGTNGTNGKDGVGTKGDTGDNGKSVETGNATLAECPDGGATVQVEGEAATKKKVCNGEDGEDGETGFTDTLPSDKTLTGAFTATGRSDFAFGSFRTAISFPIPLSAPLGPASVHDLPVGYDEGAGDCPGTVLDPQAAAGHLCVYPRVMFNAFWLETAGFVTGGIQDPTEPGGEGSQGAGTTGATLNFQTGSAESDAHGTWAVTAP